MPEENRGSWFCPCVTIHEALILHELLQRNDITHIYDLGAGDLRFSIFMDRLGYQVTAYETLEEITLPVKERVYLGTVELRHTDYYKDFNGMVKETACYACFGGTNKLPYVPEEGVAVQGFAEIGTDVWVQGEHIGDLILDVAEEAV